MKSKTATREIQKRLFTVKEAAVYLGRSVYGVRDLIWAGKLPCVRCDRRMHLDICDLEKFVEENKTSFIY